MIHRIGNGTWTCHVCGDERPSAKIDAAKHFHTNGQGVTLEQSVRYCNDRPACVRAAKLRSHTDLALARTVIERDALSKTLMEMHRKYAVRATFWAAGAAAFGFLIRGVV